jgi:hypothetical protein
VKRGWLVRTEAGQERVEADEVEITASGVLAFYEFERSIQREHILLTAFASDAWQRCELDHDG